VPDMPLNRIAQGQSHDRALAAFKAEQLATARRAHAGHRRGPTARRPEMQVFETLKRLLPLAREEGGTRVGRQNSHDRALASFKADLAKRAEKNTRFIPATSLLRMIETRGCQSASPPGRAGARPAPSA
jgi:hypothetical protein